MLIIKSWEVPWISQSNVLDQAHRYLRSIRVGQYGGGWGDPPHQRLPSPFPPPWVPVPPHVQNWPSPPITKVVPPHQSEVKIKSPGRITYIANIFTWNILFHPPNVHFLNYKTILGVFYRINWLYSILWGPQKAIFKRMRSLKNVAKFTRKSPPR